ncbi:MAG: glucose-6-phosphate isomerase [Ignavibacteriales bacterium]|nr:glucose-6-phosphate isomerase [Ignavibacteriales bacterium]
MDTKNIKISLGNYKEEIEKVFSKFEDENVSQRIYDKDFTLWSDKPTEITNRLDWLISPQETLDHLDKIDSFEKEIKSAKFTHALLLGMGGSSLAPEVFRLSFGVKKGFLDLEVLDSTNPGAVLNYANKLDPKKTLYIVSTKSGGTIETLSFFKYFFTYCKEKIGDFAGKHFIAITDPGSKLEEMAKEFKFRKIFINNPNIGGRYSVLSFFGSVPAALVGVDLKKLLFNANKVAEECKTKKNINGELGVVIGQLAKLGRDKLTFLYSEKIISFGTWVEQLIAESTGKNGVGILPVENESLENPNYYSNDRVFVYTHFKNDNLLSAKIEKLKKAGHPIIEIILKNEYDLGAEFFRWEFATAVSGWVLGIQPFDQPNVESAKIEAKAMMNSYFEKGKLPKIKASIEENGMKVYSKSKEKTLADSVNAFLKNLDNQKKYNYVSIQAYVTPTEKMSKALQTLRKKIQKKYKSAVTVGYGPRFLHSTGQLHKGDAGNGLFLQFSSENKIDAQIPNEPGMIESNFTFGTLITAQLLGDRQALLNNKRKVLTIDLGSESDKNIKKVISLV